MKKPFNLILLGDPASGKATQATRLRRKYPFLRELDFGKWVRDLKDPKKRRKYRVEETTELGKLTPTKLAREKFKEVIFGTPKHKGVFFSGSPKMLGEAKLVAKWFKEAGREAPLVVYISLSREEMRKRIEKRIELEGRADDLETNFKNRMKYYRKDIPAAVEFLKSRYVFKKISGVGTREEVFARLVRVIEEFRKSHP